MAEVLQALRDSADPLENDLAKVLDHWQDVKRSKGEPARGWVRATGHQGPWGGYSYFAPRA